MKMLLLFFFSFLDPIWTTTEQTRHKFLVSFSSKQPKTHTKHPATIFGGGRGAGFPLSRCCTVERCPPEWKSQRVTAPAWFACTCDTAVTGGDIVWSAKKTVAGSCQVKRRRVVVWQPGLKRWWDKYAACERVRSLWRGNTSTQEARSGDMKHLSCLRAALKRPCAWYLYVDCRWHVVAEWSNIWSKYARQPAIRVITNMQQSPWNSFVIERERSSVFSHSALFSSLKIFKDLFIYIKKILLHLGDKHLPVFFYCPHTPHSPSPSHSDFGNPFPNNAQSNGLEHIYLGREECSINILLMKSWEQRSGLDVCPNRTGGRESEGRKRGIVMGRKIERGAKIKKDRREGLVTGMFVCWAPTGPASLEKDTGLSNQREGGKKHLSKSYFKFEKIQKCLWAG